MKLKINYAELKNLLKEIGASEDSNKLNYEIDEFVSKLRSKDGLEVKSLDDVTYDDEGYLIAHGERIVLYIKDSKNDIDDLRHNPKGDNVVRYHIHGRCRTLERMKAQGRYNRYVLKSKPDGLFTVDGIHGGRKNRYGRVIYGTGSIITEPDVALGICKDCLNEVGIGHEKKAQEWRDTFDVEEFFKTLNPLNPIKPKWTETTFPKKEKRYDEQFKRRAKKLKKESDYKCSKCGVDLNESLATRRLLHCHHQDGNDRWHNYDNLEILCVSCHAEEGLIKPGWPNDIEECNSIKALQGILK
tara:strand:+ start:5669 stop:6568 length:900 start_codon:yes stop_codon:yes gene_type:complete